DAEVAGVEDRRFQVAVAGEDAPSVGDLADGADLEAVDAGDAVEHRHRLIGRIGDAQVHLLDAEYRAGKRKPAVEHVGLGADLDGAGLLGRERRDAGIGQRAEFGRRIVRSEERRVGKEGRSRGWGEQYRKRWKSERGG